MMLPQSTHPNTQLNTQLNTRQRLSGAALLLTVGLCSCGNLAQKAAVPNAQSRVLGTAELTFGTDFARGKNQFQSLGAVADSGIAITPQSFEDYVNSASGMRYLKVTYKITNNTTSDFNNLSFHAYTQAGASLGGTALKGLVNFGGGSIATSSVPQALKPTHGTLFDNLDALNPIKVLDNQADMQVFTPLETSAFQSVALGLSLGDSVLEYGFVARKTATSRLIPANGGTGTITLAYKFPNSTLTDPNRPYRFVGTFLLSDEAVGRVTRSFEESTAQADARKTAMAASEIALVGQDTDAPAGVLRLENSRTGINPSFLLEQNCATVAPQTIMQVQGNSAVSPLVNTVATVNGIVTGEYTTFDKLNGFYIQDAAGDSDPATSDGIFVYATATAGTLPAGGLKVGDAVQVKGTVKEFNSMTQIDTTVAGSSITRCGSASMSDALAIPTVVNFPVTSQTQLEALEGMKIKIPTSMTVTNTFALDTFGDLGLSSGGRVFNPSNGQGGTTAGNALRLITLSDASSRSNTTTPALNPIPFLSGPGLSGTRRTGDTVTNLEGFVSQRLNDYKLEKSVEPVFTNSNPRTTAPSSVGGTLRVAGGNVLNFFTTINATSAVAPSANCTGTVFSSTARGANTCLEFERQREKVLNNIQGLNPDVMGLMEVENNGTGPSSAIQSIVNGLNARVGAGTYAFIPDPATGTGTDVIQVAIIYKPSRVTPVGVSLSDNNVINNRAPVAQTFRTKFVNAGGVGDGTFSVLMNHMKSKGSCPTFAADPRNIEYGQGCWDYKRLEQVQLMKVFVEQVKTSSGDPDVIVMGDLNAYGAEDPINYLASTGPFTAVGAGGAQLPDSSNPNPAMVSLNLRIPADDRYSYQFSGTFGYLDHALASSSLDPQITGLTEWHINSDEPTAMDYNLENRPDDRYDGSIPQRSSDHDPVLVGLNLNADTNGIPAPCTVNSVSVLPNPASMNISSTLGFTATVSSTPANCATAGVTWTSSDTNVAGIASSGLLGATATSTATTGTSTITATSVDNAAISGTSTLTVNAVPTCVVNSVTVNPASATLTVGGTTAMTATVNSTPANCSSAVTWNSADNLKATVNSSGLVTAVAVTAPTVQITATSSLDNSKSGSSVVTVNAATPADVVISQFYGGGGAATAGPTFKSDYIELHNRATSPVTLTGYSIQYASAAGNFSGKMNLTPVTIPASGFYLIELSTGTVAPALAPVADQVFVTGNSISASATAGKIALVNTQTLIVCGNAAGNCFPSGIPIAGIVDFLGYGTANNFEGTVLGLLSNVTAAVRNSNGCTDTNNNLSDFTSTTTPAPRNSSSPVSVC
jgi:uncharacterized protein